MGGVKKKASQFSNYVRLPAKIFQFSHLIRNTQYRSRIYKHFYFTYKHINIILYLRIYNIGPWIIKNVFI